MKRMEVYPWHENTFVGELPTVGKLATVKRHAGMP